VSEREREYQNGEDPTVLDVIDVPVLEARPSAFQSENWLLDPNYYWSKVGRLNPSDLSGFVDNAGPLWVKRGLHDRLAAMTRYLSILPTD